MRVVRSVLCLIALADFIFEVCSNVDTRPALVWWAKKPLTFRGNQTGSDNIENLKGILPDVWDNVVEQCRNELSPGDLEILKHEKTLEVPSTLTNSEFSQVMEGKTVLLPLKLRREKSSVLGMSFVKLIDSPGVAVIRRKTLTGTDLLNSILVAWPVLIFVVLSASLSGFIIWFLVSVRLHAYAVIRML